MKNTKIPIIVFIVSLVFSAFCAAGVPDFNPQDCRGWHSKYNAPVSSMPGSSGDQIEGARGFLLQGDFADAIEYYMAARDSSEWKDIRDEYAFTLACAGMPEPAMAYLDADCKEDPFGADSYFYAGWVFYTLGYRDIGREMWKTASKGGGYHAAPAKDALKASDPAGIFCAGRLPEKKGLPHGIMAADNGTEDANNGLYEALKAESKGEYFRSIYLFLQLAEKYPGWVLPYMGCSLALEDAGAFEQARAAAEAALSLAGLDAGNRKDIEARIKELKAKPRQEMDAWMENKRPAGDFFDTHSAMYYIAFGGLNTAFGGGQDFYLSASAKLGLLAGKETDIYISIGYYTTSGVQLGIGGNYRYYFMDDFSVNPGCSVNFGISGSGFSLSVGANGGLSWYFDAKKSSADLMLMLTKGIGSSTSDGVSFYIGTTRYF